MCSTLNFWPELLADLQRLGPRHFEPLERLVGLDDLLHLGFDRRKVFLRERLGQLEVVVEAAFDRRPEGQLHALQEPHHRPGHDVGRRVPHHAQRLGVFRGEDPDLRLRPSAGSW